MDAGEILKSFDIGLSRAISYTFPGFLLVSTFALVDPSRAKSVFDALGGWPSSTLCAVFSGLGLYAIHRGFVIPFHHLVGCIVLRIGDWIGGVSSKNSLSPTRWLRSRNVPTFRLMLAYGDLRRFWFEPLHERTDINVKHAETGLPVMISEAIIAAAIYSRNYWLLVGGGFFYLLSTIPAMQQHRVECAHFKTDVDRADKILSKFRNL